MKRTKQNWVLMITDADGIPTGFEYFSTEKQARKAAYMFPEDEGFPVVYNEAEE